MSLVAVACMQVEMAQGVRLVYVFDSQLLVTTVMVLLPSIPPQVDARPISFACWQCLECGRVFVRGLFLKPATYTCRTPKSFPREWGPTQTNSCVFWSFYRFLTPEAWWWTNLYIAPRSELEGGVSYYWKLGFPDTKVADHTLDHFDRNLYGLRYCVRHASVYKSKS